MQNISSLFHVYIYVYLRRTNVRLKFSLLPEKIAVPGLNTSILIQNWECYAEEQEAKSKLREHFTDSAECCSGKLDFDGVDLKSTSNWYQQAIIH